MLLLPLAKVLVGTVLYVAVLWEARRSPRAAGMMLTFPTLNGIGMLVTDPRDLEAVASTMLLLPVINAIACFAYIDLFERLVARGVTARDAAWGLLAGIGSVWSCLTWQITQQAWQISTGSQTGYATAMLLAGVALTFLGADANQKAPVKGVAEPVSTLVIRNRHRIGLFVIALSLVMAANAFVRSPALLGVLSAVPIIAFFGMHTVASDDALPVALRRDELRAMASGVWLGPVIAIAFVIGFWRWLRVLSGFVEGVPYLAFGIVSLLCGWGLCAVGIWAADRLLLRSRVLLDG